MQCTSSLARNSGRSVSVSPSPERMEDQDAGRVTCFKRLVASSLHSQIVTLLGRLLTRSIKYRCASPSPKIEPPVCLEFIGGPQDGLIRWSTTVPTYWRFETPSGRAEPGCGVFDFLASEGPMSGAYVDVYSLEGCFYTSEARTCRYRFLESVKAR